jgi:tetratricopeptide (TPR) repeat protein
MTARTLTHSAPAAALRSPSTLGARVRQLRQSAGMSQDDLAAGRCSKEYISQIERGKTRPTAATLEWISESLSVDVTYLETGQSWTEYAAVEAVVARAEAAVEGQHYEDALEIVSGLRYSPDAPELELRGLLAQSWATLYFGDVKHALELLGQARAIAENEVFSDVERADVLYRMGVCRYKLSSINSALLLLNEALELAQRSGLPCDRLRADILEWRSRCSRRQRDFEAAREDIELALELAEGLEDTLSVAHVMFQASLVAERSGNWVRARTLAEKAKDLYEQHGDRLNLGRMLNNLGGLEYLLGKPEEAVDYLKRAFSVALELGSEADAAQAVSSLAQVHLGTGDVELAEKQSRHALELLGERDDFVDEIGNAQIVLGRALLEQDRLDEAQQIFEEAETSFAQLSSVSHRAVAWTAQGDVASKRGDAKTAATLYRRAAEALQDVRF